MFKPYRYEKKKPSYIKRLYEFLLKSDRKTLVKVVSPVALFIVGFCVLCFKVISPIVLSYANSNNRDPVINPFNSAIISTTSKEELKDDFTFSELNDLAKKHSETANTDYTSDSKSNTPKPENFYISIPKLEIYDAIVNVDSDNMDPKKALGHFKGSCLPGEGCNSFIYGHSTFGYLKNKYKEGDYSGVFSHLDELQFGDEFTVRYMGTTYRYIVDFTRVQDPKEVDPLGNPYPRSIGKHESTVELFTCTPSGTTKYRLSVVGKLIR